MTSPQFAEWIAYSHLEPFGEERAEWGRAQICSTISNVFGGKKATSKPADFIIDFLKDPEPKQMKQSAIKSVFKAFCAIVNKVHK